jgi:hypothetical protein
MQGEAGMIEALKARVNGDETLVRRGRFLSTTFLLEVGQTAWLISIFEGKVVSVASGPFVMPSWSFALRAPEAEWQKFWSSRPPPGSNDLMALIRPKAIFKSSWPISAISRRRLPSCVRREPKHDRAI